MGIWNRREHLVEEEDEDDKPIEEQILDKLKEISLSLAKFDKRLTALETKQTETVGKLQFDLRENRKFVESLLAGLLTQHFTAKPAAATSSIASRMTGNSSQSKLSGPKEGAKLPG